jgi:hypothetical protein
MRWPRRRSLLTVATVSAEIVPLTPRIERVLVTLAVHAAQLDGRLERLERRLDETVEAALDGPSHDDVLEVRLHSARLAAELARVAVELRGEIDRLAVRPERLHDRRVRVLAEAVLDLSDGMDTVPDDLPRAATV